MKTRLIPFLALTALLIPGTQFSTLRAGQFDLPIPGGSRAFGTNVTVLPNGNFVVTDPDWSTPDHITNGLGAVYLYDGVTLDIISTLTGGELIDHAGNGGVKVLGNGNYVVITTSFSLSAVTWASATTGVSGPISETNSLLGLKFGGGSTVTPLNNGNYIVSLLSWTDGFQQFLGAATWGNGTTGVTGIVSAANSLVGNAVNDAVGGVVLALHNGNYVVGSIGWNGSRGAATWGNGSSGVTGTISATNSLVGGATNDSVGATLTALSNVNYVVSSIAWNGFRGAATWGNGTSGATGIVSAANSLVGSNANDQVGNVTALNNGNYVVRSIFWNGSQGAATWGNGSSGVTGAVSAANSLIGSAPSDRVGGAVLALNNGNYVVSSIFWNGSRGAATWGSGTSGVTGTVSAANSLIGSTTNDQVGVAIALANGNYVVRSANWDNGAVTNVGAATWCNGSSGATGVVSAANSLIGNSANDGVNFGVTALANGNYVVRSPSWRNGAVTNVGAATWANGTSGLTGVVSTANSLIGSTTNDQVGISVTALTNGNYVVTSPNWDNGAVTNVGAATWASGTSGLTGVVSTANSLVGSAANDQIGAVGAIALSNGNYVVRSTSWDNGAATNVGAVTWADGTTGLIGVVSAANSLVGTTANDNIGAFAGTNGVIALANGDYVVRSSVWDNNLVSDAGVTSLGNGALGTTGAVSGANSVLGTVINSGTSSVFAHDLINSRIVVGYPVANRVTLFGYVPRMFVQQPVNVNLANGGTRIIGAPAGDQANLTFTVTNVNVGELTGLGLTIDGTDAASFAIATNPAAPVSVNHSTTFTVRFAPLTSGTKIAALHLSNNDPQQNPFNINLTGQVLSFTQDTDGDSLSDAEEFYLAPLGFDWQVSQPGLVNTLFTNANNAGLFTTNQIQALNVNSPLLQKNPTNGLFTLTIGVQKATDLINFSPFPMTAPQTTINGLGELEFQFSPTDNAAFFRLQSK